ncbi:S-norcoclaurine synthase 1 [Vitis vinifera]|uniref:S-norcoclaurine synthase 1 n=1 Tax=Vitis vinifera TaxID=29760 RepID=A0A438DZC1_VITVI|nr:S-norcoclaurine synthase 1 [Vitis vinifera]
MKAVVQEFFKLPLKEKNAYAKLPNGVEGYGQHFVVSQDQKLDWLIYFSSMPASLRKKNELMNMFQKGRQQIRMNYYPPCVHASKLYICGLTLLVQVDEVQGLQIKRNGKWIPIRPVPGAFIVNIGDILEIMSNEEFKSIEHRAVMNPETERLSLATFCSPTVEIIIGPLPELTKENNVQSINL